MPEIDEKYLNIYEKGIRFNKDYVISFFEEMEALPQDNWELRVDESFTKCWTSAIGSKFSKYTLDLKYRFILRIEVLHVFMFKDGLTQNIHTS